MWNGYVSRSQIGRAWSDGGIIGVFSGQQLLKVPINRRFGIECDLHSLLAIEGRDAAAANQRS